MATTLRPATHEDLTALMLIAETMHMESPRFSRLRFSGDKVQKLFVRLTVSPDALLLVAERNGELVGGIAGMVTPHWFSDDLVSNDYALFMLPEHRGGTTAIRLARAYIEWAQAKGAKMIQLGISTGVHAEETAALYKAIGLKKFSEGFEVQACAQD